MNTKHFNDTSDAIEFCNKIAGNNAVRAYQCHDGTAVVNWVPYTNYLAEDGKEYPDEVWCTSNGELIPLAKVTADHARNIVRMMLRKMRESQEVNVDSVATFLATHMPEFMGDNEKADAPQQIDAEFENLVIPNGTVFN